MKIITNDIVIKINTMYSEGKNPKIIGSLLNISPYTVKKYINNPKEENTPKITFNKSLPEFNTSIFRDNDWGDLCLLSEKESEEIRALWEEIEF